MRRYFICMLLVLLQSAAAVEVSGLRIRIVPVGNEVEPTVLYFNEEPGRSYKRRFTLENRTENRVRVRVYVRDASNTADGTLFGLQFEETNQSTGMWVDLSKEIVELAPGETERVTCTVNVPATAGGSDHVAMVYVESATEAQESLAKEVDEATFTVKMKLRFGIPVLIRVGEEEKPALSADPLQKEYRDGGVGFEGKIINTGNLALRVQRRVSLKDPSGYEVLSKKFRGYLMPQKELTLWVPVETDVPLPRGEYHLSVEIIATSPQLDEEILKSFEQTIELP